MRKYIRKIRGSEKMREKLRRWRCMGVNFIVK